MEHKPPFMIHGSGNVSSFWQPRTPRGRVSSSSGMAVISFDLPSTSPCRDARNTCYQAARYARPGRDVHPVDRASFAWRIVSGPRVRTGPPPRSFFPSAAPSPGVTGPAGAGAAAKPLPGQRLRLCRATCPGRRVQFYPALAHPRRGDRRQASCPGESPTLGGGADTLLAEPLPRHPDPLEQEARQLPRPASSRLRHHLLASCLTGIGS
jgi:hypothetical protein